MITLRFTRVVFWSYGQSFSAKCNDCLDTYRDVDPNFVAKFISVDDLVSGAHDVESAYDKVQTPACSGWI